MRLLVLLMLLTFAGWAEHDDHHERHFPLDISYLGLDDRQHEQIEAAVRRHRAAHKRFRHSERDTREALQTLFASDDFDRDAYLQLTLRLHTEAETMQAEFLEEVHRVLTPEQRRRFARYMEEWEIE